MLTWFGFYLQREGGHYTQRSSKNPVSAGSSLLKSSVPINIPPSFQGWEAGAMVPGRLSEREKRVRLAEEDAVFSETLSMFNTAFLLICSHSRLHHRPRDVQHAGVSSGGIGGIKDDSLYSVQEESAEVQDTHHLVTTTGGFSVKGLQM